MREQREQSNILYKVENRIGWIKLNRPKALNALSLDMIKELYKILRQWEMDQEVLFICLEGEGDKAFSAGGDVSALYERREFDIQNYALDFFLTEYRMNILIFNYPKPIVVYMKGLVMGGGVGLSIGASHRIVNENTKWAMPEMNIGFYPDVGGSYFLSRMPNYIGRYLALTSTIIKAQDTIFIDAADYYLNSTSWQDLKTELKEKYWVKATLREELHQVIMRYNQPINDICKISELGNKICQHFCFNRMEEIMNSLEVSAAEGDDWAGNVKNILLTKSPTSLKVTLQQLIEGEKKSLIDCFKMELELSMNFMKSHDFFEGVRAVLVDKDHSPAWYPDKIEKVNEEEVMSFFKYYWQEGINPLEE